MVKNGKEGDRLQRLWLRNLFWRVTLYIIIIIGKQ